MAAEITGDVHPPMRRLFANDKSQSHFGNLCFNFYPDLASLDQPVGVLAGGGRPVLPALHRERNRQGVANEIRMGNKIIEPESGSGGEGEVHCRERPEGLLRYFYRDAA